ncbi:MAG: FKBP-type peptidyl-prolyl cis-trans isomerase [Mariniblastus sp.]
MVRNNNSVARVSYTMLTSFALVLCMSCAIFAQDATAVPGFAPTATVQDEGSLTEKASFLIGYQMMANMKSQSGADINMDELIKGMKAADAGEDFDSFIAGYQVMTNFKNRSFGLKLEKIIEGCAASVGGKPVGMSNQDQEALMQAFQKLVQQREIEKMKKVATENVAIAEAYMKKNAATNPKVKMLPTGVQYEILTEGTGPKPTASDEVKVDYHGTFLDGTVFDSSTAPPNGRPAQPATFRVNGVVPGFSAALQNMKVGGKWRVVIPGDQGYGVQGGGGGLIGPNQALIFEISLLEIVK